ncbi:MAG: PTS sugar transporter subunit IIA [Candidatus Omnitrophica bacterium]|nr:PTS sugar transporter subunit IIA [Candidatus Omnitrophota bacterium]
MSGKKAKDIKVSSLLKVQAIDLSLQGNDKKEVIAELVELIARSRKLKNKKAFLNAVFEREKIGSTGIGNGVAIPHAKSKAVKSFIIAFGRKSEGIDFDALDGEKTYLFFILASPDEKVGEHLKILAEISRLIRDKFNIETLKKAREKKEILKIVSRFERSEK